MVLLLDGDRRSPQPGVDTALLDAQAVSMDSGASLVRLQLKSAPRGLCDSGQSLTLSVPRLSPLCLGDKQLPAPLGGSGCQSRAWLAGVVLEGLIIVV